MDVLQEEDQLTNLELEVDNETKQSLTNAAYWAKFISIFIFSCSAFIILLLILVSGAFIEGFKKGFGRNLEYFENFSGGMLIGVLFFVFLLVGAIYYFLYNFGVKTKAAMLTDDTNQLNKGLSSLKTYFIIMGVLGILTIITTLFTLIKLA